MSGRGMTLVEVLVAMVLLSMLLGGVLSAVELSARTQHGTADRLLAQNLAVDLLEEICALEYWDPEQQSGHGVDGGEAAADKATFDDVDDFDGWTETPPVRADGTAIAGAAGWTRSVTVRWVDPDAPNVVEVAESGAKEVLVEVSRGGVVYASVSRVRTLAWDEATGD